MREEATAEAVEIVRLAIAATPPSADVVEWREAVAEMIPEIAMALSPRGAMALRAQKFLEPHPNGRYLRAKVVSVDFETNTQRGIVTIQAPNSDEPESFRTERTDEALSGGKQLYDAIQEWIGWDCEFWLHVEALGNKKSVRVVQWFNPLRQAATTASQPSGNRPYNPGIGTPIIDKLAHDWGGQVAVRYTQRLKAVGIADPHNPSPDELEECRTIARTMVREEQERREG